MIYKLKQTQSLASGVLLSQDPAGGLGSNLLVSLGVLGVPSYDLAGLSGVF